MLLDLMDTIITIGRASLAGEVKDNRLNPVHLGMATTGYRVQSSLRIPRLNRLLLARTSLSAGISGHILHWHGHCDLRCRQPEWNLRLVGNTTPTTGFRPRETTRNICLNDCRFSCPFLGLGVLR
jgi:hypothetical protein